MIHLVKAKITSWEHAREKMHSWKQQELQVVFTNGCFDLLHFGHLSYLAEARELGDRLVVGLNSDRSVRELKGSPRPILKEADRTFQLASLFFVDLVVVFDQLTPRELIEFLQPDVLVKGGDWSPEDIVGSDSVLARNGRVLSLPYHRGYSTTEMIHKIGSYYADQ